jgi:hypothetical protein
MSDEIVICAKCEKVVPKKDAEWAPKFGWEAYLCSRCYKKLEKEYAYPEGEDSSD